MVDTGEACDDGLGNDDATGLCTTSCAINEALVVQQIPEPEEKGCSASGTPVRGSWSWLLVGLLAATRRRGSRR